MTKNELVILISKKAKVPDNLARELFDIFLIRIADKLTIGQTAYMDNIGYFHLRKGKIRKPEKDSKREKFESYDFIVLSQSHDLNIKSPGNLVLMVPEIEIQNRDEVDSHFRLSVEKPGMHNVKDRGTVYRLNQLSVGKRNELKGKVDNIISKVKIEKSISSKHGVLLVEMKKFSKDQLDLNMDDNTWEKEPLDVPGEKLDSIEKPKSTKEHFEKDRSKQLERESTQKQTIDSSKELDTADETDSDVEKRNWETVSEPSVKKKIELDKKVYKNAGNVNSDENDELNNFYDGLKKPIMGALDDLENKGKKPPESGDDKVNRKFKRIKLKGQSFDKKSTTEKKINKIIPIKDIDINKEKEKIQEKVKEQEKIQGKEKVKEQKKIQEEQKKQEELQEKSKDIEDKKYQKVTNGEHQMHSEKFKEPSKIKESLASMSELEEDEYAYLSEIDETYRGSRSGGSGIVFLFLFAAIIVLGGVLYYFVIHKGSGSSDLTQNSQFDNVFNTTYIDRNYDVPVSYPYSQPESEVELHGLSSEILAAEIPEEQSVIEESTTKVISNKETSPPVTNEKVTTPPVTNEIKNTPKKVEKDIVSSKSREQVSQNVFKYNDTYAVQVAAFQTKKDAEDGVKKYINRGYSAFIEYAVVKGKNWYRLRVGGFKTLEEAKKFQKSNK
jgi:cell division septation protein DedD